MASVQEQMKLLMNMSKYLVMFCYLVNNMIIDTGNIPESWLIGDIKPLYKKGWSNSSWESSPHNHAELHG